MKSQAKLFDAMDKAVDRTVLAMLRLEKKYGHHGVFVALKVWMNTAHRSPDLFTKPSERKRRR